MLLIGVDTGGTFTDFIYKDGDRWGEYKLLSTPANPAEAVLAGIRHIAGDRPFYMCHGSTVATNAILEKKGALTALVTNEGFEDVVEIARQNRKDLYDLAFHRNPPLVPATLRFGIPGRVDSTGTVIEEVDAGAIEAVAAKIDAARAESVAVCLIFSFANPEHENRVREVLSRLNIPVSLSHETLSEFREFERTSTTVINAYVSPKMRRYITWLMENIGEGSLRIMQSNGGSISAETAMSESVRTILSGPAGGAVGAFEIASMAGFEKLITFDMGGTSTDVALLDNGLPLTMESEIADYPVKVPMIDIHTVGAGGGSIADIDAGGSLKVGPESAGADPGPICYGKGDKITVTDANLYLGRLVPEHFLGGGMTLHTDRLNAAFDEMGKALDIDPVELAEGILAVANTTMERAIKVISVERGFDPREFALFSFGGAGGLHACFLARHLNMGTVLIPKNPGILSATGMLMADVIKDYSMTVMLDTEDDPAAAIEEGFGPLEEKGRQELIDEGVAADAIVLERLLDMRYRGQSFEILVPADGDYVDTFHTMHEKLYGYASRDKAVQIVNLRLRARGVPDKPVFPKMDKADAAISEGALLGTRQVAFDGAFRDTLVIDREKLVHGNVITGPAIIIEYSSTLVIPPFATVNVDAYGNLVIDIEPEDA